MISFHYKRLLILSVDIVWTFDPGATVVKVRGQITLGSRAADRVVSLIDMKYSSKQRTLALDKYYPLIRINHMLAGRL